MSDIVKRSRSVDGQNETFVHILDRPSQIVDAKMINSTSNMKIGTPAILLISAILILAVGFFSFKIFKKISKKDTKVSGQNDDISV